MDIAVSGLNPLALPGFDRGRQSRPESGQQDRTQNNSRNQQSSQNTSRENRVIRGEVLSRQTETISRNINSTQRTLQERDATFSQSDTRRFSMQAAIQAFRDTEALIAAPGEQRQVSGIIDEYV